MWDYYHFSIHPSISRLSLLQYLAIEMGKIKIAEKRFDNEVNYNNQYLCIRVFTGKINLTQQKQKSFYTQKCSFYKNEN